MIHIKFGISQRRTFIPTTLIFGLFTTLVITTAGKPPHFYCYYYYLHVNQSLVGGRLPSQLFHCSYFPCFWVNLAHALCSALGRFCGVFVFIISTLLL